MKLKTIAFGLCLLLLSTTFQSFGVRSNNKLKLVQTGAAMSSDGYWYAHMQSEGVHFLIFFNDLRTEITAIREYYTGDYMDNIVTNSTYDGGDYQYVDVSFYDSYYDNEHSWEGNIYDIQLVWW
ncbi:MAG: hypothetical protein J7502_01650 [Flavisolibacter sp.]|nr:hypothetical protein [Flavisolibacter sp.]